MYLGVRADLGAVQGGLHVLDELFLGYLRDRAGSLERLRRLFALGLTAAHVAGVKSRGHGRRGGAAFRGFLDGPSASALHACMTSKSKFTIQKKAESSTISMLDSFGCVLRVNSQHD